MTNEFLDDLAKRRGLRSGGNNNTAWFLELDGATVIEPTAFEPDATTHRGEYYYHAIENVLYKKVITRKEPGITNAYWKRVSQ